MNTNIRWLPIERFNIYNKFLVLTLRQPCPSLVTLISLMELNDSAGLNYLPLNQENPSLYDYVRLAFIVLLILIILLLILKPKKRDLKKAQIKTSNSVPLSKIILAIEIDNFFVAVSHKLIPGFEPIELQTKQSNFIWKTLEIIFGNKLCFQPLYTNRQIFNFIKGLKNLSRVELMIYTSLPPQVTDFILKKLKLSEYFPVQNRKFCDPKQHDTMKHAIDIDKESRRVVIITPNKKDHNEEDEKYFLVQNPKGGKIKNLLKDCLRHIKNLVEQNESMDTLHQELGQMKIDVEESDMSDMSDVERELS